MQMQSYNNNDDKTYEEGPGACYLVGFAATCLADNYAGRDKDQSYVLSIRTEAPTTAKEYVTTANACATT